MNVRMRRWFGTLALAAFAVMSLSQSAEARSSRRGRGREKKARYVVLQVREVDGTVIFEIVESDKVREREKRAYEDFKEAAREWMADRKEAKKHGEKFDEPKPKPPIVRKLGKSHKTREEAEEFREKIEAAWDKRMAAKKKKEEPDDTFADDDEDEKPKKRHKKDDEEKKGKGKDNKKKK